MIDKINLSVIRDTFGKVVYTHKTYEKAADICFNKSKQIKIINVILLTLTTGSALGTFFTGEHLILITSILATISLFFVIFQYNFNYEGLGVEFKDNARKLWKIREEYQNFIADIVNERFSSDEIAKRRDLLLHKLNVILENAPSTDDESYQKARKALKFEEEMTFTDEEIDMFLPDELRIRE